MKLFKKLAAIVLAATMVLAMGMTAMAAGTGSVKVTPPDGTQSDSSNTYKIYKVFDATTDGNGSYSYKLTENHDTAPAGFVVDDAGNVFFGDQVAKDAGDFNTTINGTTVGIKNKKELDKATIDAIAAYVKNDNPIDTKVVTGTTPAEFTGLEDGYYFVNTTTGTLVVIDSTQPAVDVKDKNEVPPLTKVITNTDAKSNEGTGSILPDKADTEDIDEAGKQAIAQVGKSVEYTLTVTKKAGAENYEVNDSMGTGLKYNKDLVVTVDDVAVDASNYTKTETDSSLVVKFDNEYMAGLADGKVIKLVYTCTITSAALQTVPAKNTAYLTYGHTPGQNKTPIEETEVYNAKFSVRKVDGSSANLAGAGFVLKNSAGDYYKYTAATSDKPETISWVKSIDDATEYTSRSSDGMLDGEFTGLANGEYTLVEKTVPSGYNPASDYTFTVKDKDVTEANLVQNTIVVNNKGAELPSTGGIGTTIFYVVGAMLVLGAGVLLVTRRRMSAK